MKNIHSYLLVIISSTILSSCATIFCPKQSITVTTNVPGASVYHGSPDGNMTYLGKTPLTTKVRGARKYLTIKKEGYNTEYVKINRHFNPVVMLDAMYPMTFLLDKFYRWSDKNYYADLSVDPTYTPPKKILVSNTTSSSSNTGSIASPSTSPSTIAPKPKEVYAGAKIKSQIRTVNATAKMSKKDIIKKYDSAVFMIFTSNDDGIFQGSGFFINSNGLAVSNYHCFKGTNKGDEVIKTTNGNTYKVTEVVAYSEKYDFIVFKVNGNGFNYIPVSQNGYEKGDDIFTIGSPKGHENTFSDGMISAIRNGRQYPIQISAPIDHGSSGGALINAYGQVIGITSAGRDDSGANLNFAQDIRVIFTSGGTY